ncbi:hypothetical protein C2W62_41230 [Candidatus Entotheonella serta]|nr:hypothetical protein C2W62_41230 [Candidatus Entotheonella serta]
MFRGAAIVDKVSNLAVLVPLYVRVISCEPGLRFSHQHRRIHLLHVIRPAFLGLRRGLGPNAAVFPEVFEKTGAPVHARFDAARVVRRRRATLRNLLIEKGVDIFRMKGIINLDQEDNRYVFQGVHMLFDGRPDRPWQDAERYNHLIFIGRNLDRAALTGGFQSCLV